MAWKALKFSIFALMRPRATNFPEVLDKALIRPGRFDTHVNVALPDIRGRTAILNTHVRVQSII